MIGAVQVLGALDGEEALTALGQHLSKMPMDVRLAKTLIYASMLRSAASMSGWVPLWQYLRFCMHSSDHLQMCI